MPIDFEVPPEVARTRDQVHALVEEKFRPIARHYDDHEHEVPRDLIREFHRMRDTIPAKRGPATPGGTLGAAIYSEEMAWGDGALMRCLPGPGLGGAAILANGTPEQQRKFLARFQGPEPAFGAMAMTEPGAGSDTASIRTTARRDGDSWVLNGEKVFITSASLALEHTNGLVVVWAKVVSPGASPDEVRHATMRAFVIPAGTPGARIGKVEKKLGVRASNTSSIVLEDCRVPLDHMLGPPEIQEKRAGGFRGAMATFDTMRPIVAAVGLGVARAALERTRELLRQNSIEIRYGLSPARLTAVERDFMELETKVQATRLIIWRACWMGDSKQPNNLEAAIAKAMAGTIVAEVTRRCCEMAGHLGFSKKELLEKYMRDARLTNIAEGTGEIQRLIIARRILGYGRGQLK
ncbi:MAG: acyl-CoA dehydrogenase family protein [Euryarchaeota archaeon]|nr:acyl-CoA dehydrogenase family protein [Euryarchaeota archaeon]